MPLQDPINFRRLGNSHWNDIADRTDELEKVLKDKGVEIKGGSRIHQYRQAVEQLENTETASEIRRLDWGLIHQAAYELEVINRIVAELSRPPEVPGWHTQIGKLLSGHALPQTEATSGSSRDFQFELYIASTFRKAGFAIELAEPDVIVDHPNLRFAIAAKRPNSRRRLEKTIRKACKQIQRSGLDGIIALDVSLLYNSQNQFMSVVQPEDASAFLEETTDNFLHKNADRIASLARESKVFGILVFMSALMYISSDPKFGFVTRWVSMNLCQPDDPRHLFLRQLTHDLRAGIE